MRIKALAAIVITILSTGLSTYANEPDQDEGDLPVFKDGFLTIPRVDTTAQPGKYQDATFQLTEQGTWHLLDYKTTGENIGFASVESVGLIATESLPVQVFLIVNGYFPDLCTDIGQVNQRMEGNQFEVAINAIRNAPDDTACAAEVKPSEKTIPLTVYGLSAGTYSYNVNGTTGTFELAVDNNLPLTTTQTNQ